MSRRPSATWLVRDLPVLAAAEQLFLHHEGEEREDSHDVTAISTRVGLPREAVLEALDELESLSALRVHRIDGHDARVSHVTAIGSAMLAIHANKDLAS